ncbi:hypothetical protein ACJX0J_031132, partial [Zea mays]
MGGFLMRLPPKNQCSLETIANGFLFDRAKANDDYIGMLATFPKNKLLLIIIWHLSLWSILGHMHLLIVGMDIWEINYIYVYLMNLMRFFSNLLIYEGGQSGP